MKKSYKKPRLQYYGSLASVIRGASGGRTDGGAPADGGPLP